MTALPLHDLPSELNPFVSSINGLLRRVHDMMEQQRRFIADAAHELRTPLTALSLQAENLDQVDLPTRGARTPCGTSAGHAPQQASSGTVTGAGTA